MLRERRDEKNEMNVVISSTDKLIVKNGHSII